MVVGAAVIGGALISGSFIRVPLHLYLMLLLMAIGLTFAGMGPGAFLAASWFTVKRGIAMGIVASGALWLFRTLAFVMQPVGTLGMAGRNIVTGPGTNLVDFSLLKNIPIEEEIRKEADAFMARLFRVFEGHLE
jgi:hypothetical protein